jgi:probable rRNA maturation factor
VALVILDAESLGLKPGFIEALQQVLTAQFDFKHLSYTVEVANLDEATMRELNQEQRSKDAATDVLSFPLFGTLEEILEQQTPEVPLGNLLTCSTYAESQRTAMEELILHGCLHLLGLDHETDLATWLNQEQASITALATLGYTLTGIEKGYL